jgi:hypothetical protein
MREERDRRENRWARLKAFVGVVVVAFAVTLAVVIGNRLSEEALGVLAGTVCGVGAAIPTSLIVVAVTRRQREDEVSRTRRRERELGQGRYEPRQAYPPVVVVSPGNQGARSSWNALSSSLSAPMDRDFRIVGGASLDREGVRYDDERRA